MRKIFLHRWECFFFRSGPPHPQAIARIGFGLFLLIGLGRDLPSVTILYSTEGMPLPLFAAPIPEPHIALLLYVLLLLAALGIAVGFSLKASCLVELLLGFYFWNLNLHLFPATIHRISLVLLLIFLVSGADRTLSVSMFRTHGSFFAWEPVSILAQRLIAMQVTATYAASALQKLWLPMWENGEILRVSFMSRWATPLAFRIARLPLPDRTYDLAVWCVKFVEFLLPLGLWIKKTRFYAFLLGALFHIAVGSLFSIWAFLMLIALYPCFLAPEEVYRIIEHLRESLKNPPSRAKGTFFPLTAKRNGKKPSPSASGFSEVPSKDPPQRERCQK